MAKLDLSLFPTESLKALRSEIKEELFKRQRLKRKNYPARIFEFLNSNDFPDLSKTLKLVYEFNSSSLLGIPTLEKDDPRKILPYLPSLLAQDWSDLYPREINHGEYYVYTHVDPRGKIFIAPEESGGNYGGQPFYIGKGIGNRAFDLKRNQGHGKIIKEILNDGFTSSHIVKIIFSELSEQKALEIEAKLIYYFGIKYSQHRKGWLINLSEPSIPKFTGEMQIISSIIAFRGKRLKTYLKKHGISEIDYLKAHS